MNRSYLELVTLDTFEERFRYLALRGGVGEATFGYDRYLNQRFYGSSEWKTVRNAVILRDMGCDLGVEGYEIRRELLIHHINPMNVDDIKGRNPQNLDLNNLITTTHQTHNAIHYGDESRLPRLIVERRPGDTKLW